MAEDSLYESEATRDQDKETSKANDGGKLLLTLIKNNTDNSVTFISMELINKSNSFKEKLRGLLRRKIFVQL